MCVPLVTVDLFATGKNKAKKAKYVSTVAPLQDGEMLTDTTGKKWTPVRLLSQSPTELTYEGEMAKKPLYLYFE